MVLFLTVIVILALIYISVGCIIRFFSNGAMDKSVIWLWLPALIIITGIRYKWWDWFRTETVKVSPL